MPIIDIRDNYDIESFQREMEPPEGDLYDRDEDASFTEKDMEEVEIYNCSLMIQKEILTEARRQIGLLFRQFRKRRNLGTRKMAQLTGMTEVQILDIELNRRNYTIGNFLKYTDALFLTEIEKRYLVDQISPVRTE